MANNELWRHDNGSFTVVASAAVAADRAVKIIDNAGEQELAECISDDADFVGFSTQAASAAGECVRVQFNGIAHVEAAGAISIGDFVKGGANGKVVTTANGEIYGTALSETTADGEIVSVLIQRRTV